MLLSSGISWLAYSLAALLFVAAFACLLVAVGVFIWWVAARRAFYRELTPDRRQAVHQIELRNRGAPGWYLRAGRRKRATYIVSMIVLISLFVLGLPQLLIALHAHFTGRSFLVAAALLGIGFIAILSFVNRPVKGIRIDRRLQVAAGETPVGEADHRQKPGDHPGDVGDR